MFITDLVLVLSNRLLSKTENKILHLPPFQDTFVLPAMENVVMPGMSRNLEMKTENPLPETLDMSQLLDPVSGESELLDVAISPAGPSRTGSFRGSQGSLRNSPVL